MKYVKYSLSPWMVTHGTNMTLFYGSNTLYNALKKFWVISKDIIHNYPNDKVV